MWGGNVGKLPEGYFSEDKKGNCKDTKGDTDDDISAYDKIMKRKGILLSETVTRGIAGPDDITSGNQQQAQFGHDYNDACTYTTSHYPVVVNGVSLFQTVD